MHQSPGWNFVRYDEGVVGTNQPAAYGGLEKVYIVHTWDVFSNFWPMKTALRESGRY